MEALTIKDNLNFLRQVSKEVNLNDNTLREDIRILKEYTLSHSVFAMAAVQLGINKRLVFIKSTKLDCSNNDEKDQIIMINPEIIESKGLTEYWEACKSCLNNVGLVERPYMIKVKFLDENGKEKIKQFEGFPSTVISHELDHLDGILHMDRAKKIYNLPVEKRMELREKEPYKVISKTCNFSYSDFKINNLAGENHDR